MCMGLEAAWLPLLIGGALSAGGGMLSDHEDQVNAENIAGARNKVLLNTLNKNQVLADEARGTFVNRLNASQPAGMAAAQGGAYDARQGAIRSNLPTITAATFPGAAESSSLVKTSVAKAVGDALEKSQTQADNQARLGSYGDMFFNQGLSDADASRNISTDVNFANANTALVPALQDFAQADAYKPNSGLGGALKGLGSIFGAYAGSR